MQRKRLINKRKITTVKPGKPTKPHDSGHENRWQTGKNHKANFSYQPNIEG